MHVDIFDGTLSPKFATADARLRASIPLLVGGRTVGPTQSLFAEIFK
jgi:hypothetical protein